MQCLHKREFIYLLWSSYITKRNHVENYNDNILIYKFSFKNKQYILPTDNFSQHIFHKTSSNVL